MTVSTLLRTWAGYQPPVTAEQVADAKTLTVLDPARDLALDFFAAAINGELAEAWEVPAAQCGLDYAGTSPVNYKFPKQLSAKALQEEKVSFPLLALSRVSSRIERVSINESKMLTTWSLDYVLGVAGSEVTRRLGDVLSIVPRIVELALQENCHPNYLTGAAVFGPGSNTFTEISIHPEQDIQYGPAQFAGNDDNSPIYLSASIPLLTDERSGWVAGSEGVSGATAEFELGNSNGEGTLWNYFHSEFPGDRPT